MTEAGYSAGKPLHVTVATSASGSGQMQPLPMNEYIQQSLKSCFFNVDIKVNEWNTLFTNWRLGAKDPSAKGIDAINVSAAVNDPYFGMIRFSTAKAFPCGRDELGLLLDAGNRKAGHGGEARVYSG